jgi:hypothetical protein
VLVVAKLDRLTRPLAGFVTLQQWSERHGKNIVSVAESLDFGTIESKYCQTLPYTLSTAGTMQSKCGSEW